MLPSTYLPPKVMGLFYVVAYSYSVRQVLPAYKLEDRPQLFLEGVKQGYGYLNWSDPSQKDRGDLLR